MVSLSKLLQPKRCHIFLALNRRSLASWLGGGNYDTALDGLKETYNKNLRPIEDKTMFSQFHSGPLSDATFSAKPSVLLLGQYSTGKTSLIRYLVGEDFPGMRVGPEPTTDQFTVVCGGADTKMVPGNVLSVDPKEPYAPLQQFGQHFLNRFCAAQIRSPKSVLNHLTFVDTPGILSGEKQRIDRGYEFTSVVQWFAARADMILLLFDSHKLDISDEYKAIIETMKPHENKVRIVLNKSDQIDTQQLMRVYGALMWSLGKVLGTPEVARVYLGSFWEKPLNNALNRDLFELEQRDLFRDINSLPRSNTITHINELVRRARLLRVHALLLSELSSQMGMWHGDAKKQELITSLNTIYERISAAHNIPLVDFPNINTMREKLSKVENFKKFPKQTSRSLEPIETLLRKDVSRLMDLLPTEADVPNIDVTKGGLSVVSGSTFASEYLPPLTKRQRDEAALSFSSLSPEADLLKGGAVRDTVKQSDLPFSVLSEIFGLADRDGDGNLTLDEWTLFHYLIQLKQDGKELPTDTELSPETLASIGLLDKGSKSEDQTAV